MMMENSGFFENIRGQRLFYRIWMPDGKARALAVHVHGYAEHSGRYGHVAEFLCSQGYGMWSLDLPGHGKSDGVRADIKRFSMFAEDAALFLKLAAEKNPDLPLFLYSHSMGCPVLLLMLSALKRAASGAAAAGTLFSRFAGDAAFGALRSRLKGLMMTGPGLVLAGKYPPLLVRLSGVNAFLFPQLPVSHFNVSGISRDEAVRKAYLDDPLTYSAPAKARMGMWLLRMKELVSPVLPDIDLPVLILHGEADSIISPESSRIVYEGVSSADKTLKLYPGLYHEIHNEPEKTEVFKDMAEWLGKRV